MEKTIVPIRVSSAQVHASVAWLGGEEPVSLDVLDFDDVCVSIAALAESLRSALTAATPSSASVEFGVQLAAKSGKLVGLIVEGAATASVKVRLEWCK